MSVPIAGPGPGAGERPEWPASHWVFAPMRWARRCWRALILRNVDLEDAKGQMGQLIEDAEHGRPFAISVGGKPMLKVSHMERDELERLPKAEE